MIARALHRVRQFFGALRPRVTAEERAQAYTWLTPELVTLFETMMLRDQQHGIEVLARVRAASPEEDVPLFAAALLHDCGKGDVALWQRVAHVLLPGGAESRLAREDGAGWRRALWRLRYHPDIGARAIERAGGLPETVRLVREQEARGGDERLRLLQAADDA